MAGAYIEIYSMHEFLERSQVCSVSGVLYYDFFNEMLEWCSSLYLNWMIFELLKLVSLPFILLCLCFIFICDDRVFDTEAYGVADGSMDDYLGW